MQLTNILRNVAEDAEMGSVSLPLDELASFQISTLRRWGLAGRAAHFKGIPSRPGEGLITAVRCRVFRPSR